MAPRLKPAVRSAQSLPEIMKSLAETPPQQKKVRIYTRILTSLCGFFWSLSFFSYSTSEWLRYRQQPNYINVVPRPPTQIATILLISGITEVLIGTIGYWGALHNRKKCLFPFTCILFWTSVIQISCGAVILTYHGKETLLMAESVYKDLNRITDPYENVTTNNFLNLQSSFKCCGVASYHDWIKSPWWESHRALNSNIVIPKSCCIAEDTTADCVIGDPPYLEVLSPALVHKVGCMKKIAEYLDSLFQITGFTPLIIGLLKFFLFFLVNYLEFTIQELQWFH